MRCQYLQRVLLTGIIDEEYGSRELKIQAHTQTTYEFFELSEVGRHHVGSGEKWHEV